MNAQTIIETRAMNLAKRNWAEMEREIHEVLDKHTPSNDMKWNLFNYGLKKYEVINYSDLKKMLEQLDKNEIFKAFYRVALGKIMNDVERFNNPPKSKHDDMAHASTYVDQRSWLQKRLDKIYNFYKYMESKEFNYGFLIGFVAALALVAVLRG